MVESVDEITAKLKISLTRISDALDEHLRSETHLELNRLQSEVEAKQHEVAQNESELTELRQANLQNKAAAENAKMSEELLKQANEDLAATSGENRRLKVKCNELSVLLEKTNKKVELLEQKETEFQTQLASILDDIDSLQEN